jgi:hypothetical protein
VPTWTPPVTLTANTNENVNDLNAIITSLQAVVNSLDDANISATAGIQASKLATGSTGLARGAFSAYRAAAVSLATGAVVVFDTDGTAPGFDVSSWYDAATGLYTPQVAGEYRLSCGVGAAGALTADVFWQVTLRKNAAELHRGQIIYQRGTQPVLATGSWDVQANGTTDNFAIGILHGVGAAQALGTGALLTYFHGELIGPS